MKRLLIVLAALVPLLATGAAFAQPAPEQVLFKNVALPAGRGYRTSNTVDMQRYTGGAWLISATFADTAAARACVLEFKIEVVDGEGFAYAWDADNLTAKRDGFFLSARGDSSWLMTTSGSNSTNVTPVANGPAFPWKVSGLIGSSDDDSGAQEANLAVPGWPAPLTRRWAIPFVDAYGNPQWFPGRVRLIVWNRSPSAGAITALTIKAKGQRSY